MSTPKNLRTLKKIFKEADGLGIGQETLDMGVFIYLMGSPNCEDFEKYMWEGYFWGTWNTPSFGGLGGMDDL